MKVCFLASGDGGNFKFFHMASELGILFNIEFSVIADRECGSVEYASKHNISVKVIDYNRNSNESLLKELACISPDIIITNWHKIIDHEVVSIYKGKLINLHYSLLPAFAGLIGTAPIEAAYKKQCKYIGVTCHYVDTGVDSGEIIAQSVVKTDIPLQQGIEKTFRNGCLTLLNGVLKVSSYNIITQEINESFFYSPSLQFDDAKFSDAFWEKLSTL